MGVGTGLRPMRCGTSMKEIHWSSTGLMSATWFIEKCSEQAFQVFLQCAWFQLDVGKQQSLSESLAFWELTLLPASSFKISRCFLMDRQHSHTLRRCVLSLLNSPRDSMIRIVALFLLLSLAPMYSPAQSPTGTAKPQETVTKATYLVLYRPGPKWLAGKSVMEQPLKDHGKYMLSLYVKGSMKLAGPLTDDAGGAVLLEVSNEAEAKATVANDPAVKSGVFVCEMHPWKLQPWKEFAKKAKAATQ